MSKYLFTVRLIGYGDSPEQAWADAVESTNLDEDPCPDDDDYYLLDDDEDEVP